MTAALENRASDLTLRSWRQQLTPSVANALLAIQADEAAQTRYEELADRNTEGRLTDAERSELESFVSLNRSISLLKANAQAFLAGVR